MESDPQAFDISYRENGSAVILTVSGRLVLGVATNRLRTTIQELLDDGWVNLVVDLSRVTFLDSAGLGELVASFRRARRHGARLKIAAPTRQITELLEITHLTHVLDVYPDCAAAVDG